jgi:hypothetical protein
VKATKELATQPVKEKTEQGALVQVAQVSSCDGAQVKAVDVERSTITFDDTAPAVVAGKTFPVAKDAHVTIDGKASKLTALPVGSRVNLVLCVDRQTARHVLANTR